MITLGIFCSIIGAIWCNILADKKGKKEWVAIVMGLLFPIPAVLYYHFCKSEKEVVA